MAKSMRDFLIRRDHHPLKLLSMEPGRIAPYMRRLETRFPDFEWSVCERFTLNGAVKTSTSLAQHESNAA